MNAPPVEEQKFGRVLRIETTANDVSDFFDKTEHSRLCSLQRAHFNTHGLRRADLKPVLTHLSTAGITRYLKRLRDLKLVKRAATHLTFGIFTIQRTIPRLIATFYPSYQ